MPKNRQTLYAVVRYDEDEGVIKQSVLLGVYVTNERASEVRGMYAQDMKDRGFPFLRFEVEAVTFYDE